MNATEPHFRLMRRRLGSLEYAYELHHCGEVSVRGSAKGRMLRRPARFSTANGAFVIRPISKRAHRWTVTLESGRVFAHLDLGTVSRGSARVDTDEGSFHFAPIEPAWREAVQARVFVDSDTFQLLGPSGRPLAATGLPGRCDSAGSRLRSGVAAMLPPLSRFAPAEGLTVMAAGWDPAPEFIAALLVFKDVVGGEMKSAA